MEELTTQIGPAAAALVGLVAAIVQQFKRFPVVIEWQKKLPIYQILSLGIGIAGAHVFGLANPIFAGVLVGLSAAGAYDAVKTIPPAVTKTVVPFLLMACLLGSGCGEKQLTVQPAAWLLSGANVQSADSENEIEDTLEYIGRVGVQVGQTEAGIASHWWMGSPRQSYGVYAVQFLTQDANSFIGTPYVGAQATMDVEEEGGMYGFVTGTILDVGGLDVVTEFQVRTYNDVLEAQMPNSEDKYKGFIGLRFKF